MEEARRRFVQFVILVSMSSSTAVLSRVAFKGGNALRFIHGNMRSTLDLDFTAEGDFPDSPDEITRLMDTAFRTGERQFEVKARCQSIRRNPRSHGDKADLSHQGVLSASGRPVLSELRGADGLRGGHRDRNQPE